MILKDDSVILQVAKLENLALEKMALENMALILRDFNVPGENLNWNQVF